MTSNSSFWASVVVANIWAASGVEGSTLLVVMWLVYASVCAIKGDK